MTDQRRAALRSRIVKATAYFVLTVLTGIGAYALFQLSAPDQKASGNDVTPDLLLLTSEHNVGITVSINYYQWDRPSAEGVAYGPQSGSFPTGAREIQLQFDGGKPRSLLQYAVLLGRDGAESDPVGQQTNDVYSGTPGGNLSSDCVAQTAGIVQTLSGQVRLDSQGQATVDTAGALADQHAYLQEGSGDVVGVLDVNSPITDLAASGPGGTCVFPDWPYLGGILWYSPSSLGGEVSLGQIGSGYSVTSSNPPLTDLSSLSWQVSGPTAISYTLTNDSIEHQQLVESFGAGVVAAVSAALAVEAAKNAIGKASEPGEENHDREGPAAADPPASGSADKHPVLASTFLALAFWAALKKRLSL